MVANRDPSILPPRAHQSCRRNAGPVPAHPLGATTRVTYLSLLKSSQPCRWTLVAGGHYSQPKHAVAEATVATPWGSEPKPFRGIVPARW